MEAIANPALGLMVYCTDCFAGSVGCLMVNDSDDETTPNWGSLCSSNATAPDLAALNCGSSVISGALYQGVPASGVSVTVPYTGGNGGLYPVKNFSSTGVSGLIASLPSGMLNIGNGTLVFTITGTPSATGTASFTITMAGKSCTFTLPVIIEPGTISALNCGSAVFNPSTLTQEVAYNGTLTVPYTGGNGGAYSQASFTHNDLTFLLPAGTLASGSGTLVYTVTGIPSVSGVMNIPISFEGNSCNVITPAVVAAATFVLPGNSKAWMRHNLGADTSLDPDVPVQGIHGNYYQWGRPNVVADASTPPGSIAGWSPAAPDNYWQDATKTTNDPCPSGFRVQPLSNGRI